MIKIFLAFTIFTAMITTGAVYNLKQTTNGLEDKKRDISAQILKDREAIKVLKAEMAYLSRPQRLERLSRRHLVLENTENEQLVSGLDNLSMRGKIQMANMPIDNFQLLLPRQKPAPRSVIKPSKKKVSDIRLASFNERVVKNNMQKKLKTEKSLYERILAKLEN